MLLIGLCGRSGSGKGVFCNIASQLGYYVVDCDKVYHNLISAPSDCLLEIEKEFGSQYIKNGALDRPALAKLVFNNNKLLKKLNKITHKHIIAQIDNMISTLKEDSIVIFDAPTLFESGLNERCDIVVGILASDDDCITRLVQRDKISSDNAILRLNNQKSNKYIAENSDYILYNDSTFEDFEASVRDFFYEVVKENV